MRASVSDFMPKRVSDDLRARLNRALGWAEDDASQPLRVLAQLVRHRDPELAAEADAVVDGEHHVATPTRGAPGGRSPAPTHYDSFDAWARDHLIVKVVR